MKIRSIALAGCAAIAFVAIASPNHAQAGDGFAAGLLGGFAAGAIVGSTMAPEPVYVAPAPVYIAPAPVYVAPPPACYWTRGEPFWNGHRWVRPRMQVCN